MSDDKPSDDRDPILDPSNTWRPAELDRENATQDEWAAWFNDARIHASNPVLREFAAITQYQLELLAAAHEATTKDELKEAKLQHDRLVESAFTRLMRVSDEDWQKWCETPREKLLADLRSLHKGGGQ